MTLTSTRHPTDPRRSPGCCWALARSAVRAPLQKGAKGVPAGSVCSSTVQEGSCDTTPHACSRFSTRPSSLTQRGQGPQEGRSAVREHRSCYAISAVRAPMVPGVGASSARGSLATRHAYARLMPRMTPRRTRPPVGPSCHHGALPTRAAVPGAGPGQADGGHPGPGAAAPLLPPLVQRLRPLLTPLGYTLYPNGYRPQGPRAGCPPAAGWLPHAARARPRPPDAPRPAPCEVEIFMRPWP